MTEEDRLRRKEIELQFRKQMRADHGDKFTPQQIKVATRKLMQDFFTERA